MFEFPDTLFLKRWGFWVGQIALLASSDSFETRALFAFEQLVGFAVINETLGSRIPLQRPADVHRNVAQVARADAAVLAGDAGDGGVFGADAVEEVAHVVDDCVQFAGAFRTIEIVKVVDRLRFAR